MSAEAWVALAGVIAALLGSLAGGLVFWTSAIATMRATLAAHLKDCTNRYAELEDRIARIERTIDHGVQNQQQIIAQLHQLIGQAQAR